MFAQVKIRRFLYKGLPYSQKTIYWLSYILSRFSVSNEIPYCFRSVSIFFHFITVRATRIPYFRVLPRSKLQRSLREVSEFKLRTPTVVLQTIKIDKSNFSSVCSSTLFNCKEVLKFFCLVYYEMNLQIYVRALEFQQTSGQFANVLVNINYTFICILYLYFVCILSS